MIARRSIKWRGQAIECFAAQKAEGYSEYWRRDKSPVELLELSKLLFSIRRIVSYVGRNTGEVVWEGMECRDGISLDPSLVMGSYPVSAAKTDVIIGIAVEKAYQKTEWSERLKKLALEKMCLSNMNAYRFSLFFDIAEKIYADILSNRNVLGLYTKKAREFQINETVKRLPSSPTVTELLHLWWKMAFDGTETGLEKRDADVSGEGLLDRTRIKNFYKGPWAVLNSIMDALTYECPEISGVRERCTFRLELYASIWPKLFDCINFWFRETFNPRLFFSNIEGKGMGGKEKDTSTGAIPGLGKRIEDVVKGEKTDFTADVKSIVSNVDKVVCVKRGNALVWAKNKVDRVLFHKLCVSLRSIAHRKSTYNRGLRSGKLDHRRLFRASTTGTVFNLKRNYFEFVHDVVLLVDCSGSMSAKWEQHEVAYQTLFAAIKTYNGNARIFGYNGIRNICSISELFLDGRFLAITPEGKTASGEAIIAAALSLKRGRKVPLMIHITDGASNWGCGVSDAVEFCRKKKIHLLTLGIGCDQKSKLALREEYGNLICFVDNMKSLPVLLKRLLRSGKGVYSAATRQNMMNGASV
ncbi:vWA domain-containing protein [Desulfobacterium sp. N47]|uniref:VWFA domain-containing protein n=1 Tax=uncultured Desulfobacterium sp. TaxID=201089 RepID=E1YFQ5_9BACT|nr:hypothetical protein N47_J03800 [uncultured Desulfobacterium sp.]